MVLKKEWDYFPHIWKTEAQYLSWVRGQIRQIWKTSPQRNEFLKGQVKKFPKYDKDGSPILYKNGKEKLYKAYLCNCCEKICYDCDKIGNRKTYAVDHIIGNHSLTSFEQAPLFFEAMLRVNLIDLQVLCNTCHDIKSYSEKYNVSLEEALLEKHVIDIINKKEDKEFFTNRNLPIPKNLQLRRLNIKKILLENYQNKETT